MGDPASTSDLIDRHITRLWQEVIEQAGGKPAPTETLLPVDLAPDQIPDLPVEQAPEPRTSARNRGVRTPPPSLDVDEITGTRTFTEFNRRYRLIDRLDAGGMGSIFVARQHILARNVAVKILRKDDTTTRRLLFRAEALVTAYLEHPNIIPVYDAADNCLVMRKVEGSTLDAILRHGGPDSSLERCVEILLKVCDAVAFAHSRGIIHRDLKAENVLVGHFGEVLVADWGLALSVAPGPDGDYHAPRLDRCHSLCAGTPGCLPPEIARAQRELIGHHTDLHMLGGMLYTCLTGELPFQAANSYLALSLAAENRYPSITTFNPQAPPELVAISQRAMSAEPGHRGDLDDFVAGLRAWLRVVGHASAQAHTTRLRKALRPSWWDRLLGRCGWKRKPA
jgi:serine/threonine protein kinase